MVSRARDIIIKLQYDKETGNASQVFIWSKSPMILRSVFRDEFFTIYTLHIRKGKFINAAWTGCTADYRVQGTGSELHGVGYYETREQVVGRSELDVLTCLE